MDLNHALKLAETEARTFVGRPEAKCPADKTGLLILVYRKDTTEAIAQADVSVSGGGKAGRTDANGIAHENKPCAPGEYDVAVTALPDQGKLYAKPYPKAHQGVPAGTCPVCSLPVDPRKYWVKVRVVDKDSGKDVAEAKVKIKLPAGWKSDGGDAEATQSTKDEGTGANIKKIAHFKDITPGTAAADKCKIEFIEVEGVLEFVEIAAG